MLIIAQMKHNEDIRKIGWMRWTMTFSLPYPLSRSDEHMGMSIVTGHVEVGTEEKVAESASCFPSSSCSWALTSVLSVKRR